MANKKITELTALTAITTDDLLAIVDDPSGSPVTKEITVDNFFDSAATGNCVIPATILTTIGDLIYASAANTPARLADVAVGSVFVSGGVGAAPSWSATPTVASLTSPTVYGSAASGGNLTLHSTSHATKGLIYFGTASVYDQVNDRFGIGTTAPGYKLQVTAAGTSASSLEGYASLRKSSAAGGGLVIRGSDSLVDFLSTWDISNVNMGFSFTPTTSGCTQTEAMRITSGGNVGIGTTDGFGTSAAKVLSFGSGTAPTTSPADVAQTWVADVGGIAGKAGIHHRAEDGGTFAMHGSAGTLQMFHYQNDTLADDGTVTLPDATSGMVFVSCNAESGMWSVQADGTCTKVSGTTNTDAADTDAKLDVYDGGTGAIVKNRLGAVGETRIVYFYQ